MVNIAVVSGGTAANSILDVFQKLADGETEAAHTTLEKKGKIWYILPISDNGGSTSEIIRVLGGCSVGDLRSRITRLIPQESSGLRDLLSHRLSKDPIEAKAEWEQIVEGSHPLWLNVDPPCKQIMRSFLIHVHTEVLKRSRNSTKNFRLELASVGNLFLTGARLFCGSLDSSIELVLRITRVPSNVQVLPCINTNFTYHISALLKDGTIITGQSQISHPSFDEKSNMDKSTMGAALFNNGSTMSFNDDVVLHGTRRTNSISLYRPPTTTSEESDLSDEDDEFETPSYIHPELKKSQLHFNKDDSIPLQAPVERIFYISPYGEEIYPVAYARVLNCLREADTIIYSIGSLMTSIIPVLILQGAGDAILHCSTDKKKKKKKVLLLNGSWDRETSGMTALDCMNAIRGALNYSMMFSPERKKHSSDEASDYPLSSFVTHILYLASGSEIPVDVRAIESMGVKCIPVMNALGSSNRYDLTAMYEALAEITTE